MRSAFRDLNLGLGLGFWGLGIGKFGRWSLPNSWRIYFRVRNPKPYLWPPKTDLFKKLCIETIVRNPKKGRFFRPQAALNLEPLNYRILSSALSLRG